MVMVSVYSVLVGAFVSRVCLVTVSRDVVMGYEKQPHAEETRSSDVYCRRHFGTLPNARLSRSSACAAAQSIGSCAGVGSGARSRRTASSLRFLKPPGPWVGHESVETVVRE